MANKKSKSLKHTNNKSNNQKNNNVKINQNNRKNNRKVMKILTFLGVVILCIILLYLADYFFVKKSYIKINISTDKRVEYLTLNNEEELVASQKYVSDLNYSMRYDIESFRVFKYKTQDIYQNLNNDNVIVAVEKSSVPSNCGNANIDNDYNNCYIIVDNFTDEYYISTSNNTFKITVKKPNTLDSKTQSRIKYMLDTFEITV